MPSYDKTDLTSVLEYIRDEYGSICFKDGTVIDILSDLAPNLKREYSLLKKLVDKGLLKEIAENSSTDEDTQKKIISKTRSFLVDDEFLQPNIADFHIGILCKVLKFKTGLSVSNSQIENKLRLLINAKRKRSIQEKKLNETSVVSPVELDNKPDNLENSGDSKSVDESDSLFQAIMSEMVTCPAGRFIMGSPETQYGEQKEGFWNSLFGEKEVLQEGELGRYNNENQHEVIISKEFKIGKYPVTQKLYKEVMGGNPAKFKGDDYPVEHVSWNDAKAFCDKLNKKYASLLPAGYMFDLPTEAQWEYACRAGTTTALNNGKNLTSEEKAKCINLDEVSWYNQNSENTTHPVGNKKPNEWGIYDMHGNVWEWCRDWYDNYLLGSCVTDPVGPSTGSRRILRGGSWFSYARCCRSAFRSNNYPDGKVDILGFRLAIVPIQ